MRMPMMLPGLAVAAAVLASPLAVAVAAEPIVPPSNSAAAQYTEAFPTAGGEQKVGGHKKGKTTPAQVLGGRDTHRLESKGKQGREVAKFAAETAPAPAAAPVSSSSSSSATSPSENSHKRQVHSSGRKAHPGGSANATASPHPTAPPKVSTATGTSLTIGEPSGSSGFGEVIGQATGSSSSGQLGLLLPLVVIGAIVWALIYFWRQRRRIA